MSPFITVWLWLLIGLPVAFAALFQVGARWAYGLPLIGRFLPYPDILQWAAFGLRAWFVLTVAIAPTLIAHARWTRNRTTVMLINLLVGWTGIGWVVSLAMSFSSDTAVPGSASGTGPRRTGPPASPG